ncbi:MAG: adenylate/guanylate cyclase domain-containing protein [Spirochaetaceae bacterium]|nr:MAG: adenylate/guanylate cyclase domain-containing protein [Spirochaetaceae bacterium]
MSIRLKVLLVVLPILIPPLIIAGAASALSARGGISAIGREFLQFKAEELVRYAGEQWRLLVDNELSNDPDYVSIAQQTVQAYASGMIRRDSELVFAVQPDGELAFATRPVQLSEDERRAIVNRVRENPAGWESLTVGGVRRVAQSIPFAPFDWVVFFSEEEAVFYGSVQAITRQTAIILAASVLFAVLLLVVFTRSLLLPLSRMAITMRRIIGEHDLSQRVEVLYRDEIGDLGHTFNLMTDELSVMYEQIKRYAFEAVVARRQERKIRTVFQKYVPIDVIDQIFAHPESILVGQTRTLAVLFSDIRSFTSIAERLPPEQIVASLNGYFSAMVDTIVDHNGIVDKYIGDAIMAFFGAPVSRGDDAHAAVRAGLDMLAALNLFNARQAEAGLPAFRIGVGINYGPVTIGNIGSDKKMDYTVVGDMVNLASRLEGLTKLYHVPILVSESVAHQVMDTIPCRWIDTVRVKGKTEASQIYAPYRSADTTQREGWALQERGMTQYFRGDFREAARFLLAARKLLPKDPIVHKFLIQCKRHIASPPPPDWSGITTLGDT